MALSLFSASGRAQTPWWAQHQAGPSRSRGPRPARRPQPPSRMLSAGADIEWTNRYFFRGIVQETEGAVLQPRFEARGTLYESGQFRGLNRMRLFGGIWSSVHTANPPVGVNAPTHWYQADLYAGFDWLFWRRWELAASYRQLMSPAGRFATFHEIHVDTSYDDTTLWIDEGQRGFTGFHPRAKGVVEVNGSAFSPEEGVYAELGVEPSATLWSHPDWSFGVSLPTTVGIGILDYYSRGNGDEGVGYVRTGLWIRMVAGALAGSYGRWELRVGGDVLFLGQPLERVNRGRDAEVIMKAGLGVEF